RARRRPASRGGSVGRDGEGRAGSEGRARLSVEAGAGTGASGYGSGFGGLLRGLLRGYRRVDGAKAPPADGAQKGGSGGPPRREGRGR
ncbi:MAG: hypothetical protein ACRDJN_01080, partial [Chloroflexota bacterium]